MALLKNNKLVFGCATSLHEFKVHFFIMMTRVFVFPFYKFNLFRLNSIIRNIKIQFEVK